MGFGDNRPSPTKVMRVFIIAILVVTAIALCSCGGSIDPQVAQARVSDNSCKPEQGSPYGEDGWLNCCRAKTTGDYCNFNGWDPNCDEACPEGQVFSRETWLCRPAHCKDRSTNE